MDARGAGPSKPLLGSVALCSSATAIVLFATSTGVGVSPDSTAYFALARRWLEPLNLAPLQGPSSGSANFGPLYPASLAVASVVLQQDPMPAARWLNAVVLPANLLLVGLLLHRAVPAATAIPWLGALLFLTAPDLLTIHTMAWSEAVFLTLIMLGVLAVDAYLAPDRRSHDAREPVAASGWRLAAVALIASAACLQRYAGAALVLTAMAAICLWGGGPARRRVWRAFGVGAVASLPTLVWLRLRPGFQGPGIHLPTAAWLLDGWRTMTRWVVPDTLSVPEAGRGWLAFALLAGVFLAIRGRSLVVDRTHPPASRVVAILWLFMSCYAFGVFVALTFWDARIPAEGRILAPFWVAGMLLVMIAIGRADWRSLGGSTIDVRIARAVITAFALVWLFATLVEASTWVARTHREGQGYNSRSWQQSEIIQAIRALPEGTFLVSNGNDAITAVTGRPAARLPDKINPATVAPNPNYSVRLAALHSRLKREKGVVVFLYRLGERFYIPNATDLQDEWGLIPVARTADGAIYRLRGEGEE